MTANLKGPLPTKNNLTGIQECYVTLVDSTPKTYTHGCNAFPVSVQVYKTGIPVQADEVAVTTAAGTIMLTSNRSGWLEYTVLITWALPSEIVDGVPTVNFV